MQRLQSRACVKCPVEFAATQKDLIRLSSVFSTRDGCLQKIRWLSIDATSLANPMQPKHANANGPIWHYKP